MPCFEDIEQLIRQTEYEDALNLLENQLDGLLYAFRDRLTALKAKLNLIKATSMTTQERIAAKTNLGQEIVDFAREFCDSQVDEDLVDDKFNSQLLMNNSYPFADRSNFRNIVRQAMKVPSAQVILVDGIPKSGMSHLGKFLQHSLSDIDIIEFYPFNVGGILDEPESSLGEILATSIAIDLGLDIDFSKFSQDLFKFKQFFTKLKDRISSSNTVPIFFLHDFHKAQDNNQSLLSFVQILIEKVYGDFPKSIFILAGLKFTLIPRWVDDLEFMLDDQIYNMEPVSAGDIETCMRCIFAEYENKIAETAEGGKITEEEYVTEILDELLGVERNVNLVKVGRRISRLLTRFKN